MTIVCDVLVVFSIVSYLLAFALRFILVIMAFGLRSTIQTYSARFETKGVSESAAGQKFSADLDRKSKVASAKKVC